MPKLKFRIHPIIIFTIIFIFFFVLLQHDDPDMYYDLAYGKQIFLHGIIHHPILTQVDPSRQYLIMEWLFQLVLYLFVSALGFNSFHLFIALFAVAQVIFLYLILQKIFKVDTYASALLLISYTMLTFDFIVARPAIIANVFLIASIYLLLLYVQDKKNFLYLLLPIEYLWANMHSSFILGPLICFAYALVCLLLFSLSRNKTFLHQSGILLVYTIGLFGISILPPVLFDSYKVIWNTYKYWNILPKIITEWTPLIRNQHLFFLYIITASVTLLAFITVINRKKLFYKAAWLLPLLVFILYGYFTVRNVYFAFLAVIIILGWTITHIQFSSKQKFTPLLTYGIGMLCVIYLVYTTFTKYQQSQLYFPQGAANFIQAHNLKGNMFNQFSYGGYLEYRLYPPRKVFLDGFVHIYLCCEIKDYWELQVNAPIPQDEYEPIFTHFINKYHFSYAVLGVKNDPSGIFLSNEFANNSWLLVYHDDVSQVWLKNDGLNTSLFLKMLNQS